MTIPAKLQRAALRVWPVTLMLVPLILVLEAANLWWKNRRLEVDCQRSLANGSRR